MQSLNFRNLEDWINQLFELVFTVSSKGEVRFIANSNLFKGINAPSSIEQLFHDLEATSINDLIQKKKNDKYLHFRSRIKEYGTDEEFNFYVLPTENDGELLFLGNASQSQEHLEFRAKFFQRQFESQHELFEAILENIPNMIFLKEASSRRFQYLNRAGEDLLNLSRESIIGKVEEEVGFSLGPVLSNDLEKKVIEEKRALFSEEERIQLHGKDIYLKTKRLPVFDVSGSLKYILGISEDVSAAKKQSDQLTEVNNNLVLAQDLANIGSWHFNVDTGVIRWSDQMFKIFSENKDDGEPDYERHRSSIHPEDVDYWEQTVNECVKTGLGYLMHFRTIDKQGEVHWVRACGRAVFDDEKTRVIALHGTCQDITEEKKLANENDKLLRLSNSLQKVSGVGGWELDLKSKKILWTEEAARVFRASGLDSIEWNQFLSQFHADSSEKLLSSIQNCEKMAKRFDQELLLQTKHKEGELIWLRIVGEAILNKKKEVSKIAGTIQDVSVQKRAELEFLANQNLINKFFDVALDLFCVANLNGYFERVNPMFMRVLGYTEEELLSTPYLSIIHPEDIAATQNEMQKFSKGKSTVNFKNRFLCKDGSYRVFNWSVSPDPNTGLLYAAAHDITETVYVQEQLEENLLIQTLAREIQSISDKELYLEDKLKLVSSLIKQKEFLGVEECLAFLDFKDGLMQVLGSSCEGVDIELLESSKDLKLYFSTIYSEPRKNTRQLMCPIALPKAGSLYRNTHLLKLYAGEEIIACILLNLKGSTNCSLRTMSHLEYLSEVIAELILKERIKLELYHQKRNAQRNSKLAALGELAAGVGHEINNPLAIAIGYLDMLDRVVDEQNPAREEVKVLLDKIGGAAERIANIVRGLRTFAREENGKREDFTVADAIMESCLLIRDIYLKDGYEIRSDIQFTEEVYVHGDRGKILQVLMNLISNAKDSMENSSVKEISIIAKLIANRVQVQVCDRGVGISADLKERVFDPFFTTKETSKGVGIGLSIAHSIISDHEGDISFTDNQGGGTIFSFDLPVVSIGSRTKITVKEDRVKKSFSIRAILVDDEEGIRDYLEFLLQDMGVLVKSFSTAEEAYTEYLEHQADYDLIISDMKMPGMSGSDLLSRIRKNKTIIQPMFIMITGGVNVDLEDRSDELVNLIDGFFYKPFNEEKVYDVIGKISSKLELQTWKESS